ncbi:MAG TPA: cation-translocating P-type ATPase [Bacillota bacterium]|nr:cation-translocating P-type ATPase [Bacillota bacterium]
MEAVTPLNQDLDGDLSHEWHRMSIDGALRILETDGKEGLSSVEAKSRLERYGPNALAEEEEKTLLQMFIDQFKDFLVLILVASTVIAAIMGEWIDASVIMAILILNAIMGVVQEGRAGKALAALKKMAVPVATVVRDRRVQKISSEELVPGDVVLLQAGDLVPADLRLIETVNTQIDESALTGESVPVEKDASRVFDGETSLGDRANLAYFGTVVTYGRGAGVVTSTGMATEIGKIAKMVSAQIEEDTPLQKKLAEFGKLLGFGALAICALVFVLGLIGGEPAFNMFMTAVSLAVAAIPEGLPAVVTIVLALGVQRMITCNAIVRRLPAVETLGCVTYICSDKTGTLTENKMTVRDVFLASGRHIRVTGTGYAPQGEFVEGEEAVKADHELLRLLDIAAGCNDASIVQEEGVTAGGTTTIWSVVGDPTEGALVTLAAKGNRDKATAQSLFPRIGELPFDSDRKRMTTLHRLNVDWGPWTCGDVAAFVKGAPDILLSLSSFYFDGNDICPLSDERIESMLRLVDEMGRSGLRVLGFAARRLEGLPSKLRSEDIENGLVFVGLVGMIDPVRPEVVEAIKVSKKAGVTPVMVTGDYPHTAQAIAMELGMFEEGARIVTGAELDKMDQAELEEIAKDIRVYARVSPEHKLRLVHALKKHDEIVAMLGDGVNDAPALGAADIGVAMGLSGTEVAKGASDMVLTDDNFASIVAAIEQGRIIFENIRKSIIYLLSCNIGELMIFFVAILAKLGNPLVPVQILMINLVTDGLPALALGMDPSEEGIMDIPPRDTKEGILSKSIAIRMFIVGMAIVVATLWPYVTLLKSGAPLEVARTSAFAVLGFSELLRALSSRSERHPIWHAKPKENPQLLAAVAVSALLLLISIEVPWFAQIFDAVPLGAAEWRMVAIASFSPMVIAEVMKLVGMASSTRRREALEIR